MTTILAKIVCFLLALLAVPVAMVIWAIFGALVGAWMPIMLFCEFFHPITRYDDI